jgi:hypothetical protein
MLGTRIAPVILKHETRRAIGQLHIPAALFLRTARDAQWIRGWVGPKAANFPYKIITLFTLQIIQTQ